MIETTTFEKMLPSLSLNRSEIRAKTEHNKNPNIANNNLSKNFLSVFNSFKLLNNLEFGSAGIREKLANRRLVVIEENDNIPDITSV